MGNQPWRAGKPYEILMQRASTDPVLREMLRTDPRGTLQRELAISLPEGVQIDVLEETTARILLVLPAAQPALGAAQLSDDQLDRVAGGAGGTTRGGRTTDIDPGVKTAVDL